MTKTIFSIANNYFRNEEFDKAFILYDFLVQKDPKLEIYKTNKSLCIQEVRSKKSTVKRDFTDRALQAADILAKDKYFMQADECLNKYVNKADAHLIRANIARHKSTDTWLSNLNSYLCHFNVPELEKSNSATNSSILLSELSNKSRQSSIERTNDGGAKVTVMMSCFNAENTIGYALRSLVEQTYNNIEIFVVDDCSNDNSVLIAEKFAKKDSRIKIIKNKINCGTYFSRNTVFKSSTGKFFTILDSDDFALPDRIERQVKILEQNKSLVGTVSNWLRVAADGEFIYKSWSGSFLHEAVATLMFRTSEVRKRIGFWDSVRMAADTEFMYRIEKEFGSGALLRSEEPVAMALYHENSLTRHPINGISENEGLSPARKAYRSSWMNWHKNSSKCFIEFPLIQRKFEAPESMLYK